MAANQDCRTRYGANKYAALHLLLARWLRNYAKPITYRYVTLGGTELKDCQSINFVDPNLTKSMSSFEQRTDRHEHATEMATKLAACGISVSITKSDIFDFARESDDPHLFFFDFEQICALGDLHMRFGELFLDGRLRENDTLFLTSYLGRNPGWNKMFSEFDSEFRVIGVTSFEEKKRGYRRSHPSFTLYRGLSRASMQGDLLLRSIGCIEYHDSSPMGIYGFVIEQGVTDFAEFIRNAPYYNTKSGSLSND